MIKTTSGPAKSPLTSTQNSSSAYTSAPIKRKSDNSKPDVEDQIVAGTHSIKKARQGTHVEDAFGAPEKYDKNFNRFLAQVEGEHIDQATGRSFGQMLEFQLIKSRPLIIARCTCNRHTQDSEKMNKFSHAEFMDGYVIYEALQNELLSPSVVSSFFGDHHATTDQKKKITSFISRDLEFWAINPRTKSYDVIAQRADVIVKTTKPRMGITSLLSCDTKPFDEEDADDHIYSYVAAGMYHCGYMVEKDQSLAKEAVRLMKEINFPHSQSSALQFSLDVNIDVFKSLGGVLKFFWT